MCRTVPGLLQQHGDSAFLDLAGLYCLLYLR